MTKKVFLSLGSLGVLIAAGLCDFVVAPQPAGAESEASLEAPMLVGGRRRGRRGRCRRFNNYNQAANQQAMAEQRKLAASEAQNSKFDAQDANRRANEIQHLKKSDVIHEYGSGR